MDPSYRNVYIIGAQSTGKTTLTSALEEHFNTTSEVGLAKPAIIRETARHVLRSLGLDRNHMTSSHTTALAIQKAILEAQLQAERTLTMKRRSFISDRSGLDPLVYAETLVGAEAADDLARDSTWQELERNMKAGVVVLCEAGGEDLLVDDGMRLMPKGRDDWVRFDMAFRRQLAARDIAYTVIPHDMLDIVQRVQVVLSRMQPQ